MSDPEKWSIEELRDPRTGELLSTAARYKAAPSAKILDYYQYDESAPLECPHCGWSGLSREGAQEQHRDLFDVSCPRCEQMLLIVGFPTVDETREAAAAGHPRAIENLDQAERIERRWKRARELELKEDSPLPPIDGTNLRFVWDIEGSDDEQWTVIRCGDQVLWRELAYWEGWERFNEVKCLLKDHYAEFESLMPTDESKTYLLGDDLSARLDLD